MNKRSVLKTFLLAGTMLAMFSGCGQSPEAPVKVLMIGNACTRDCMYYLPGLAQLGNTAVEAAYLDGGDLSLRDHAHNLTFHKGSYDYYEADSNGKWVHTQNALVLGDVLAQKQWDVVILQHHTYACGFTSTYNSDLEYLLDAIRAKSGAKVYWNVPWAMEGSVTGAYRDALLLYYDGEPDLQYNAIIRCTEQHISGENATFREKFAGWIPTGFALEQLRAALPEGTGVTVNGYNLTPELGRFTAAATILKTLFPDMAPLNPDAVAQVLAATKEASDAVRPTEAQLTLALTAVERVCSMTNVPQEKAVTLHKVGSNIDTVVCRTPAPTKTHFPDGVVLADGTMIVGAYENVAHKPDIDIGEGQGAGGRIVIWRGTENASQWHYDEPLLVIDEKQMEAWGLAKFSDRYAEIEAGNMNYAIYGDPRDPNFNIVYTDINGDGTAEEVLLLTFWMRYRTEKVDTLPTSITGYLCYSTDGGSSWSVPQVMLRGDGVTSVIKRGNLASYADGQIAVPYYRGTTAGCLLMEFDSAQRKWVLLRDTAIPNLAPEESEKFNEVSLVAPKPETDILYAYCRENGTMLLSGDRGMTWKLIANEEGLIHQPGFAILDEDHIFVTWAMPQRPRATYGKVFHLDGDWNDTSRVLIYDSLDLTSHDIGDPSCILLPDGRLIVISYDTAYRCIVGVYVDPTEPQWQPK